MLIVMSSKRQMLYLSLKEGFHLCSGNRLVVYLTVFPPVDLEHFHISFENSSLVPVLYFRQAIIFGV